MSGAPRGAAWDALHEPRERPLCVSRVQAAWLPAGEEPVRPPSAVAAGQAVSVLLPGKPVT